MTSAEAALTVAAGFAVLGFIFLAIASYAHENRVPGLEKAMITVAMVSFSFTAISLFKWGIMQILNFF